jgi:hypothetical protein
MQETKTKKTQCECCCEVQTPTMDDDAQNIKTPSSLNAKLMNKKVSIIPSNNKCFVK